MTVRQLHICKTEGCSNPCHSEIRRSYCKECLFNKKKKTHQRWQAKNKKRCSETSMKWQKDNPEKYKKINQRWYKNNISKVMFSRARKNARTRNIIFTLKSWKDIPSIPEFCPVLGIRIRIVVGKGHVRYTPSLDRINSSKGYVKGNLRIISRRANELKRDATLEELVLLGKDGRKLLRVKNAT